MATLPLSLPHSRRLKRKGDFVRARQEGQRTVCGCLILNWVAPAAGGLARLGVITSKQLGGAVERSRARRLMREVFRLHQHELAQPLDLVLVARRSIHGRKLAGVERDFLRALREAKLLKPAMKDQTQTNP